MSNYSLYLPVKPYIYKYVSALEGAPLSFISPTFICSTLRRLLNVSSDYSVPRLMNGWLRSTNEARTQELEIVIHSRYHKEVVATIDENIAMCCNFFLENHFKRTLSQFVESNRTPDNRYEGYRDIVHNFARLYNLSIEEDISFDSLKQNEYRLRKKSGDSPDNLFCAPSNSEITHNPQIHFIFTL